MIIPLILYVIPFIAMTVFIRFYNSNSEKPINEDDDAFLFMLKMFSFVPLLNLIFAVILYGGAAIFYINEESKYNPFCYISKFLWGKNND